MRWGIALGVLGFLAALCAPLFVVADDLPLEPAIEESSEPSTGEEEPESEPEEEIPDPGEMPEPEIPVEEPIEVEPPIVGPEELLEVEEGEPFIEEFNLLAAPEAPDAFSIGTIVYDFPTQVWGGPNEANGSCGPYGSLRNTLEDNEGAWDPVACDFSRWLDTSHAYTFTMLETYLVAANLSDAPDHPLLSGSIYVRVYEADASWDKGTLVAESLPLDAATIGSNVGSCSGDGTAGNPFSAECIASFSFAEDVTLDANTHYVFEIHASDVVSVDYIANGCFNFVCQPYHYYPTLLILGASVSAPPFGIDGIQKSPSSKTGSVYMRLSLSDVVEEPTGPSSVLFLPGFLGSRLYTTDGRKLWEPNGSDDFLDLALNEDGTSMVPVYVGDTVDFIHINDHPIPKPIYGNLMEWLATLAADEVINDWAPYPYDWRYDVFDVVDEGALKEDGSREYLIPLVEELAVTSSSQKVTIIGHSNGGLLAKALMIRLAEEGKADLVDKIIFIGTPQVGTPKGMLGLLHGHDIGRPFWTPQGTARASAATMPGAYALLPSAAYFSQVSSPVADFAPGTVTSPYIDALVETIASFADALSFMLNDPFTRATPTLLDEETPYPLSSALMGGAATTHDLIDAWAPPSGTEVYEIAGWGNKTIFKAHYYTETSYSCPTGILSCGLHESIDYEPQTAGDGDDTVLASSALFMDSGVYFDLAELSQSIGEDRKHENLTESSQIHAYLEYLFGLTESYNQTLFPTEEPQGTGNDTIISVHSPVIISLKDSEGRETGIFPYPDSDLYYILEDIPGSSVQFGGEGKYIFVPSDGMYEISIQGIGEGVFTVKVQEPEQEIATSISRLPVTVETYASMTIENGIDGVSLLEVDEDGDGVTDIIIAFEKGEETIYEEPAVEEVETPSSDGGGLSPKKTTSRPTTVAHSNPDSALFNNPYLNPPLPFIPYYPTPGVDALEATATAQDIAELKTPPQTASAYDALKVAMDWINQILQKIFGWVLGLVGMQ